MSNSNELLKSLSKDYSNVLETEEFSDTEILIGKEPDTKIFHLHSFVLKIRSPYFRIALSNNWSRTENNVIKFKKPNISIEIFDILIKYIYSGTIDLSKQDIKTNVTLLITADELCLNELCEYIENYLLEDKETLKCNFILIQHVSGQFNHFTKLLQFYIETFKQDPSLIFRANDFITVKQEILLDLLIRNNHSLKPIEVWDKLMEWCIAQPDKLPSDVTMWTADNVSTLGELIQPFISYINFEGINRSDFVQKVKPYKKIFDPDFYIKILEFYSFNGGDVNSRGNDYTVKMVLSEKIDSEIIDLNSAFLIASWIKLMKKHQSINYEFKLLVRGSKDGFETSTFKKCCYGKGSTIIVARVKNTDEILGGFNPVSWTSGSVYSSTKESFIFSLNINNLENSIFSKVVDEEYAIYNDDDWCIDFGSGDSDLRLLVNSTNKGQCYKENYEKLIRKDEGEFEICDYETFQVIDSS